MTEQLIDTAALRALATEAIKINEANRPDSSYEIPVKVVTFGPQTVLALLDENERKLNERAQGYEISLQDQARKHADLYRQHAALCVAILAGRWDEAARLARGKGE